MNDMDARPRNGLSLWQQHMRGALSQLPMASGPWIWKPPAKREPVEQMALL